MEVACTLSPADLRDRRGAWTQLSGRALTAKRTTSAGVELAFTAHSGVESTLRELTRLERECCSFADWEVRREAGALVLEVSGRGPTGAAAVRELFAAI